MGLLDSTKSTECPAMQNKEFSSYSSVTDGEIKECDPVLPLLILEFLTNYLAVLSLPLLDRL